ncbi:MAG: hypothetical protein L0H63_15755 [Nitrococcus sp.]|nr:hypothetical protein [Nitrococcus sp.]
MTLVLNPMWGVALLAVAWLPLIPVAVNLRAGLRERWLNGQHIRLIGS